MVKLAPSAFLSSAAFTQLLQSAILGFDWPHSDAAVVHIHNIWVDSSKTTPPVDEQACEQRHWDVPVVSARKAVLEFLIETPFDRAGFLAVTSPHAGDWLKAPNFFVWSSPRERRRSSSYRCWSSPWFAAM